MFSCYEMEGDLMTIKEIAEIAGVSQGTVSKVLNHRDASISEETRNKVLRVAREQHYRPYAEVLKAYQASSHLIGILIRRQTNFQRQRLIILEEILFANGYSLMTGFFDDKTSLTTQLQGMAAKHVDMVLLSGTDEALDEAVADFMTDMPICKVSGSDGGDIPAFLVADREHEIELAANYLIQTGHREIGLLSVEKEYEAFLLRGLKSALYHNGIPYDERNVCFISDYANLTDNLALMLFNKNVTALICDCAELAGSILRECENQGMRVPEDMSILCTENSGIAAACTPAITVVGQDIRPRMEAFVRSILNYLEKGTRIKTDNNDIGYFILERDSVAPPARESIVLSEKILVVGSMNIDETIHVRSLPSDGETLLCDSKVIIPGGKGANQAVGVARLGGNVSMIGCLGNDFEGRKIYSSLKKSGVNTDAVTFDMENRTGKAYIQTAENGESTIVVYPGANKKMDKYYIQQFEHMFGDARMCLLPIEILAEPMLYALDICKQRGIISIVKPSLQTRMIEPVLAGIDYLVPNEKELYHLVDGSGIEDRAMKLLDQGVGHVIVTLGASGCYLKDRDHSVYIPAADFVAVDVTGAADAFIAALAVSLNAGNDVITAICSATYAAGISITRMGVQTALADELMMEAYQDNIRKFASEIKEGLP